MTTGDPFARTACVSPIDVALIMAALIGHRFDLATEASIQAGVEAVFTAQLGPAAFRREARLSARDRPDFLVGPAGGPCVAIEIKHRRAKAAPTLAQLARYAGHDQVCAIILATGWPMALPAMLNGKPLHVVSLGRAWL